MRISDNANFDTVRETIRRSKTRMEGLQKQASTLKKLNAPGDDPVSATKVLEMRTDKVNNEQFQMNGKMAESYLNNTDHALSEFSDIVSRAKEIAIGQASGASSNDDTRLAIAEEVTHLFQSAVAVANRRIGDRYIFGGYKTDVAPVSPEGQYVGDDGQIMVEVGRDVFLSMNIPGNEAFNTDPNREKKPVDQLKDTESRAPAAFVGAERPENVNIFEEIKNLRIGLLTGDLDTIRNTLDRFDQMHSRVNAMRAKVGSRLNGLQSLTQSLERQNITNAQLSSHLEDADMAQVVSDLAKEETVFRSALQTSTKLMQPKLLDFLR